MHFIFLGIGLLIGLFALYRFFLNANVQQIKAFSLATIVIILSGTLFFMAVSGKLPAAIGIVAALFPFIIPLLRRRAGMGAQAPSSASGNTPLSREDALEILGLGGSPSEEEIRSAYKKLMRKVHPDQDGSEWMARQLNAARDLLLARVDKQP